MAHDGDGKPIRFAMIGHGFMGKAHSYALLALPFFFPSGLRPVRQVLCGRHEPAVRQAARAFGWEEYATDWRAVVRRSDIDAVVIVTPPAAHGPVILAAAAAGKHILCEKPLTVTVEEAQQALAAVQQAGVVHMVGYNYRRVPALAQARRMIADGRLGRIHHFRAVYLQDWIMDPRFPRIWKLERKSAGSGAHHELNAHLIDLALYLVGGIRQVVGMEETFIKERPARAAAGEWSTMLTAAGDAARMEPVDVDDATLFLARFTNGALGSFEATRFAAGRRNHNRIEINGSRGSLGFDLENLNRLEYHDAGAPADAQGFGSIQVNEACHPYLAHWWPPGHALGYENTFVNQYADFMQAIAGEAPVQPDFAQGLETQKVLAAVTRSIAAGRWCEV